MMIQFQVLPHSFIVELTSVEITTGTENLYPTVIGSPSLATDNTTIADFVIESHNDPWDAFSFVNTTTSTVIVSLIASNQIN